MASNKRTQAYLIVYFFKTHPTSKSPSSPHQAVSPSYPPSTHLVFLSGLYFQFLNNKKNSLFSVFPHSPFLFLLPQQLFFKSNQRYFILDSHPTKFKDKSCDDKLSATKEWSPMNEIEGLDFKQRRKKVSYHPFYKDKLKEISDR